MDLLRAKSHSYFADRLMWLARKVTKEVLCSFTALAWFVWFCPNKAIFVDERV